MFTKLKKFILGDKRPIVRSVSHPVVGTLTYSEDDEAWLIHPETSGYGFGFYIAGDWDSAALEIRPALALLDHAAAIAANSEAFAQSVQEFIDSQLQSVPSLDSDKDEVRVSCGFDVA